MRVFKKALSTTLAATMMFGLVACGGKGEGSGTSGTGVQNTENKIAVAKEESAENVYSLESGFGISGMSGSIRHFKTVGESIFVVTSDSKQGATGSDASASDAKMNGEDVPKDNICRIYKASTSGGAAEAVYETSAENAGEALEVIFTGDDGSCYFITSKDGNSVLYKYTDGGVSEVGDAGKLDINGNDALGAAVDKDGNIIAFNDTGLKILDASLNELSSVSENVRGIAVDANGDPIVETIDTSDQNNPKVLIKKLDVQGGRLTDEYQLDTLSLLYENPIIKGTDGYDFYYVTDSSIYGFKYDGAVATKIVNFSSSNINGAETAGVSMLDTDNFVLNSIDFNTYTQKDIKKYAKVDPSQVSDQSVFTLATLYSFDGLKDAVIGFNESQSDIKVELVDYSESSDPSAKFSADIAAGTTADFYMCSGGIGDMSMHQCISKGMLEDLTPYLENDPDISKDDFIPTLYDAMFTDGKMYFAGAFAVPHTTIAKTSEVGTETGWTFTEVKEKLDSMPEDTQLMMINNKMDMFESLSICGMSDFVNWEKGECYFDSDDFKSMLEICNRGTSDDTNASYALNYNRPEALRSGKQLLVSSTVDPFEIVNDKKMFGEEITFKGFPNRDRQGNKASFDVAVGMSSQCENKEAAWSFIKYLLSSEYQGKNYMQVAGVPVRKDVYAAYEKYCMATESYTDEYGNNIEPRNEVIESSDFVYEYKPVSQADVDEFRKLIDSISGCTDEDIKVTEIVKEEVSGYFSGEKSIEDVCSVIQDRVGTYINENK